MWDIDLNLQSTDRTLKRQLFNFNLYIIASLHFLEVNSEPTENKLYMNNLMWDKVSIFPSAGFRCA